MSDLEPYEGEYPGAQEDAEAAARGLVDRAGGYLTSRQALAVLRVAIESIESLAHEVEALRERVQGLEHHAAGLTGED